MNWESILTIKNKQKPSHSLTGVKVYILGAFNFAKYQEKKKLLGIHVRYFKFLRDYKIKITNKSYILTDFWANDYYIKIFFFKNKNKK